MALKAGRPTGPSKQRTEKVKPKLASDSKVESNIEENEVQELRQKVKKLEEENALLKSEIEQLKSRPPQIKELGVHLTKLFKDTWNTLHKKSISKIK